MSMQRLKKIGKKLLELESGNEALTDGRFGGYIKISRNFFVLKVHTYPSWLFRFNAWEKSNLSDLQNTWNLMLKYSVCIVRMMLT